MTTTTSDNGRLGNQIIRNLAVSFIARKNNLYVKYSNFDTINNKLGINLYIGQNIYHKIVELNDYNYFNILSKENVDFNLNANNHYFQTQEITDLIYNNLRNEHMKNIIEKNRYKNRYKNNNDLFIHIRLGDVIKFNPGSQYYLNAISNITFDNLYISSDTLNHEIVINIKTKFPNAILFSRNEIETIQFASTCKYIILSHGTFSAVIGYLSFFSKIFYPYIENHNAKWCNTYMMTNKNWNPIKY